MSALNKKKTKNKTFFKKLSSGRNDNKSNVYAQLFSSVATNPGQNKQAGLQQRHHLPDFKYLNKFLW